jgi:hypothetical protein
MRGGIFSAFHQGKFRKGDIGLGRRWPAPLFAKGLNFAVAHDGATGERRH